MHAPWPSFEQSDTIACHQINSTVFTRRHTCSNSSQSLQPFFSLSKHSPVLKFTTQSQLPFGGGVDKLMFRKRSFSRRHSNGVRFSSLSACWSRKRFPLAQTHPYIVPPIPWLVQGWVTNRNHSAGANHWRGATPPSPCRRSLSFPSICLLADEGGAVPIVHSGILFESLVELVENLSKRATLWRFSTFAFRRTLLSSLGSSFDALRNHTEIMTILHTFLPKCNVPHKHLRKRRPPVQLYLSVQCTRLMSNQSHKNKLKPINIDDYFPPLWKVVREKVLRPRWSTRPLSWWGARSS